MNILRVIADSVKIVLLSAGAVAIISAFVYEKMVENFENKVEREVNRRLRGTKVVSHFDVRVEVVDETPDNDA